MAKIIIRSVLLNFIIIFFISSCTTLQIHDAVKLGDISQVNILLSRGVDVNTKDKYGFTPLHYAARDSNSYSKTLTKLLLEHGANINAKDLYGTTPLHIASNLGNRSLVKVLVENGADVNIKQDEGAT